MPFKYCTDCGYKNIYTTRQAKFCAGCGESLIGEKSPAPQIAQANSSQGDISSENKGIPNIQKLEYTVDSVSKAPKIGDLINTRNEKSERFERQGTKTKSSQCLSIEEAEAQSMQECSSSRNRTAD